VSRPPWEITDDNEYDIYVRELPTARERVTAALRESRFVTGWFPPYSSGATDMIEKMLEDLEEERDSELLLAGAVPGAPVPVAESPAGRLPRPEGAPGDVPVHIT